MFHKNNDTLQVECVGISKSKDVQRKHITKDFLRKVCYNNHVILDDNEIVYFRKVGDE